MTRSIRSKRDYVQNTQGNSNGIQLDNGYWIINWTETDVWGTVPYTILVSENKTKLFFENYGYEYTWNVDTNLYEDVVDDYVYTLKITESNGEFSIEDESSSLGTVEIAKLFTLTSITTETEYDSETALPVDTDFLITYTGNVLSDNAVLEIKDASKISLVDDGETRDITSTIITHEGKSTLQVKPDSNLPRDSNFQLEILEGALKSEKDAEEFVNRENVFYYSTNNEEPEDTTPPVLTDNLVDSINEGQTLLGSIRANEQVEWSVDNNDIKLTNNDNQENTVIVSLKTGADLADGFYLYTITATDTSDNTSSVTKTVNVVDITPPVLTDNLVDSINIGQTSLGSIRANEPVEWSVDTDDIKLTNNDNQENTVIVSLKTGADPADGFYLYTITATDTSDNTTSVTTTVNVAPSDVIITNTDDTTQYVMLKSSDNGVLDMIGSYKDTNGNNIVRDNIKKVVIQGSVTSIGYQAFVDCRALQSVIIGDSVTSIGTYAFYDCDKLQSVIMGNNVEAMGIPEDGFFGDTFAFCDNLETVILSKNLTNTYSFDFRNCPKLKNIVLPDKFRLGYSFDKSGLETAYVTPNNINIKLGSFQIGTNQIVGNKGNVTVISTYVLNVFTYPINGNIKDFEVKLYDSNNNEIPNLNTITNLTDKNGYYNFSFVKPEGSTNTYRVETTTKDDNDKDITKQAEITFGDDEYEKTVYVGSYSDFLVLCKKEIKTILQSSDNEDVKQLTDEQIDELISEELSVSEGVDSITLFELTLEMYINTIKKASKDPNNDVNRTNDALETVVVNFLNSEQMKAVIIQTAVDKIVNSESNGLSITSKNQLDTIATKIRSEQIISALVGLTSTELGTPFDANTIDAVVTYGDDVYDKMKKSLDSNPTLTIDDKITSMSKVYTASVTKLENDNSENGVPESIPTDDEIEIAIPDNMPSFNPRPEPEPQPDMTQEITVAPGWNWISFYLRQDDNSLNNIQLTDFNGDQVPLLFMKDQNNFSEYYGENTGWFGALTEIDVKKTFLFKNNSDSPGKLTITGQKEGIVGIPLETGWNWIGYPRSEFATLWTTTNSNGLLSQAKQGDFIKDQNNFATYYDGVGWFGALTILDPGKGYFYKSVENNFLVFINNDDGDFIPSSNRQSLIKEAINPEDIVIDVNKVKSQTFKLLNKSAHLYKGDNFLNEINISRIDEDNARILCVTNKDCSVYANYKSKSEDIYGTERPITLEMITNHNVYGSKLSILKLSQHGDLKNGNTEIYANNKGLIYIHRGILYQNIPVYVDIKFDYNVETQEPAELTILIYLTPSYTSEILLGLLYQQVTPSLPTELLLQNEVIDGEYRIRINFLPGIEINNLLETGLSFLYNNSVEKKGIELVLKDSDSNAESTSIIIDTLNDPKIIYTTTKEDGIDENTLPDVTIYTIDNDKIVYDSNTTGNAGEGPLAEVFKNGVTIEYESIENVHELAMQASGDREYPLFIIDGDMPDKYKIDENDSTSTQERLNQVPFGIGGYINIMEPKDPADKDGRTELFWAAHDGDLSKVQKLVNEGANVNQRDNLDYSPLYWAAHNGYDEVVKVLLENGALLNLKYKNDWSPLYWASHNGHEKVVELLLNSNVHVNIESTSGRTALHWATVNNNLDEVELLVEAGAQLNKDKDGYTALDWAKIKGYKEIEEILEKL